MAIKLRRETALRQVYLRRIMPQVSEHADQTVFVVDDPFERNRDNAPRFGDIAISQISCLKVVMKNAKTLFRLSKYTDCDSDEFAFQDGHI